MDGLTHLAASAIAGLVLLVLGVVTWYGRQTLRQDGQLMVRPSRVVVGVVTAACLAIGLPAAWTALYVPGSAAAAAVAAAMLAGAGFAAMHLLPWFDIVWDGKRIEGPSGLPLPGRPRRSIPWENVARTGQDLWGNAFLEDITGARIRWNWLYSGYDSLAFAIEEHATRLSRSGD